MQQKTILCFGDSNTWGYVPGADGERVPLMGRWPSVMDVALNGEEVGMSRPFIVVAEGLNGRTTVFDDPFSPGRSGAAAISMLLETHAPVDLVIIMLGTNDTKNVFQAAAEQIALGADRLLQLVAASDAGPGNAAPPALLVAPPPVGALDAAMGVHFAPEDRARAVSAGLAQTFRATASEWGAAFFDAGTVAAAGSDGIHLDVSGHRALGTALAEVVALELGR